MVLPRLRKRSLPAPVWPPEVLHARSGSRRSEIPLLAVGVHDGESLAGNDSSDAWETRSRHCSRTRRCSNHRRARPSASGMAPNTSRPRPAATNAPLARDRRRMPSASKPSPLAPATARSTLGVYRRLQRGVVQTLGPRTRFRLRFSCVMTAPS